MRPPPRSAVVRARWLAELATTLGEALRLTMRWAENDSGNDEAVALVQHIRALQAEVETLRRGNRTKTHRDDPIWTYLGEFTRNP